MGKKGFIDLYEKIECFFVVVFFLMSKPAVIPSVSVQWVFDVWLQ